jgi:hypothetical protein
MAHLFCQSCIFLQKLDNTVRKLGVIHAKALHLVKGYQNSCEKQLVFLLQRQGETINDRSQNLQQLRDSIETLSLVNKLEEHIVDRATDKGA